jgi:hypothetical protein
MMTRTPVQRWPACFALIVITTVMLWGCAAVPRRYIWIAEPGVTLTMLSTNPQPFVGKVVLLGGDDHRRGRERAVSDAAT